MTDEFASNVVQNTVGALIVLASVHRQLITISSDHVVENSHRWISRWVSSGLDWLVQVIHLWCFRKKVNRDGNTFSEQNALQVTDLRLLFVGPRWVGRRNDNEQTVHTFGDQRTETFDCQFLQTNQSSFAVQVCMWPKTNFTGNKRLATAKGLPVEIVLHHPISFEFLSRVDECKRTQIRRRQDADNRQPVEQESC